MKPLRVLIADDDTLMVMDLKEQIESLGHEVVATAADGAAAVELARIHKPDLITLDIEMPRLDGIEAAAAISKERKVPLILVSAYTDEELLERASSVPVLAYIVKPINSREIDAALRTAVARFREIEKLETELTELQNDLRVRKKVERAKGILMRRLRLNEGQAFTRLQRESQNQNKRMEEIADAVIAADQLL